MAKLSPLGAVYQAGTLSGNPIAMAAGLKMMEIISREGFYPLLNAKTTKLVQGMQAAADEASIPFSTTQVGGMFGLFFTTEPQVSSYQQATACDVASFNRFFHGMLERGIYLAPSAFEAGFMSTAHSDEDINTTIAAACEVFALL
jgi:glutamate-1-semialdehyde 2,1-aminomutase